jgi:hypothetical protein
METLEEDSRISVSSTTIGHVYFTTAKQRIKIKASTAWQKQFTKAFKGLPFL